MEVKDKLKWRKSRDTWEVFTTDKGVKAILRFLDDTDVGKWKGFAECSVRSEGESQH